MFFLSACCSCPLGCIVADIGLKRCVSADSCVTSMLASWLARVSYVRFDFSSKHSVEINVDFTRIIIDVRVFKM